MGLANQERVDIEEASPASMGLYPLTYVIFLHQYVKGRRDISALLAFVDLSIKQESTNLFPRIKWVHGDEKC